ncbi:MAG: glutamine-hydrolyzing carbamoyl-phosphate synthase small subunit [Candidatus Sumerlaeia bacterium]|nr:glutamine-hydrolyzing carbamoyl-phosphate synthase small subunit [Candidatus Sumerlaeia bacterium]
MAQQGPSAYTPEFPPARLVLEDGREFAGHSFGYDGPVAGEVVFSTGMVGYPEALTDPSFYGQILTLTFPLVGNYGVPGDADDRGLSRFFESHRIQATGLVVCDYSVHFSHWEAARSLARWLQDSKVPALMGIDTRALTKHLRVKGSMLGKIVLEGRDVEFWNPNAHRLIEKVSIDRPVDYGDGERLVIVLDCGCKESIVGNLLERGVRVRRVPHDYDLQDVEFDGVVVSSGPGDPKMCHRQIHQIRHVLRREKPLLGICLGHQMLALAAGAETYKMKYGHRSQNQPVIEAGTGRCFVTSQNHGYAVDIATLPEDWESWFSNINDGSSEGIRHKTKPFMSVQFHPEAAPGPVDTMFLFDDFVRMVNA